MTTQHTPAPWSIDKTLNQIRGADKTKPAVCGACYVPSDQSLIAAAPEMLDMLYTLLPYIEEAEKDPSYKAGAVAKITKELKSLIEKAEGK